MAEKLLTYYICKDKGEFYGYGNFWLTNDNNQRLLDLRRDMSKTMKKIVFAYVSTIFLIMTYFIIQVNDEPSDILSQIKIIGLALSITIPIYFTTSLIISIIRGLFSPFFYLKGFSIIYRDKVNDRDSNIGVLKKKSVYLYVIHLQKHKTIYINFDETITDLRKDSEYWLNADDNYRLIIQNGPSTYHSRFQFDFPEKNHATVSITEPNSGETLILYTVDNVFNNRSKYPPDNSSSASKPNEFSNQMVNRKYLTENFNCKYKIRADAVPGVKKELILCCGAMLIELLWQIHRPYKHKAY